MRENHVICLLVKVKLVLVAGTLDLARVGVLEIALDDVVAVLADSAETGFLHDGGDDGTREGIVADDERVEVDLGGEAHLAGDGAEDETALTSVAQGGEFDLSVETAGTEESGIEGVGSVGGHDDLDVRGLIKTIHLVEEFKQNTLHLSVGTGLGIETLGSNGIDLVDENDGR